MYYITGIDDVTGSVSNDSSNLSIYFELGWEIMTTHLHIKELLFNNLFDNENDTIVTCDGREFLYKENFKNVITWEDYKKLNLNTDTINLCDRFINDFTNINKIDVTDNQGLIDLFSSFEKDHNYDNKPTNENYVCLVYRNRSHGSHRNMDEIFFKDLISSITKERRLKTYVVGFGGEIFENGHDCFHVTLKQFTTLINKKECLICVSSLTGPANLTYFFGNENLKNIILDLESARSNEYMKNHPLAMGDRFNYKKIDTQFIDGSIDLKDLKTIINNK